VHSEEFQSQPHINPANITIRLFVGIDCGKSRITGKPETGSQRGY